MPWPTPRQSWGVGLRSSWLTFVRGPVIFLWCGLCGQGFLDVFVRKKRSLDVHSSDPFFNWGHKATVHTSLFRLKVKSSEFWLRSAKPCCLVPMVDSTYISLLQTSRSDGSLISHFCCEIWHASCKIVTTQYQEMQTSMMKWTFEKSIVSIIWKGHQNLRSTSVCDRSEIYLVICSPVNQWGQCKYLTQYQFLVE